MKNCRKVHTLLGITCLVVFHANGQSTSTDTLKLETAVVESPWSSSESRMALSKALLTIDPGAGLADDLGLLGENVQDYGIPGSIQLLRPSGLAAELATFSWNGLEINAPGLGLLDLSLIPARFATLTNNPGSNFGRYALEPARSLSDELQVWSSLNTLHNKEYGILISETLPGRFRFALNAMHRELLNDFEFNDRLKDDETITQTHNDGLEWQLAPELSWKKDAHSLTAFAWWSERELEIPELMGSYAAGDAIQEDRNLRWGLSYKLDKGRTQLELLVGEVHDDQRFRDLLFTDGNFLINSHIQTLRRQSHIAFRHRTERTLWTLVAHPEVWSIEGNNYENGSASQFRSRVEAGMESHFRDLSLKLNLGALTAGSAQPTAGAELKYYPKKDDRDLSLGAKAQRLYRWPTLNEMFWMPGGNPAIRPEHGWNGRIELTTKFLSSLTLETGLHYTTLNDRILWKPLDNVWSPVNVDQVQSKGANASLTYHLEFREWQLDATANYHYVATSDESGNDLPYAPRHRVGSWFSAKNGRALFFSGLTATGMRYSGFEMDVLSALDPNQIWQAGIGYELALMKHWSMTFSISAENILDQQFEQVRLRPTPGRSWRFSISIQHKTDQTQ